MPWLIGIDEAGYGPNLGPFVMTSVAVRLPEHLAAADLWHVLGSAVRRTGTADDGRLLIEDSKLVYSTRRGLASLERGVLAAVSAHDFEGTRTLSEYLEVVCPASRTALADECWFTGTSLIPGEVAWAEVVRPKVCFQAACAEAGLHWGPVRSIVVCPSRFNQLLDRWGTKGAVLGESLGELLRSWQASDAEGEPVSLFVDKHGGRNTYAAMLQHALPDGLVMVCEESPCRSVYQVTGAGQNLRITFQPRAEAEHLCVALASMVSKYVRELLMKEFNHYWLARVPGLKPTAGYPGDASRFFSAIRPFLEQLQIAESAVWRRK